jgi:hypothetical protein
MPNKQKLQIMRGSKRLFVVSSQKDMYEQYIIKEYGYRMQSDEHNQLIICMHQSARSKYPKK